jgi:hypothetical protein
VEHGSQKRVSSFARGDVFKNLTTEEFQRKNILTDFVESRE